MTELDRVHNRRVRLGWLVVLAVAAGIGTWLTLPLGIVELMGGDAWGWLLVATGTVLLALCSAAIVFAVRIRVVPESQPGKANQRFGEPEPSKNPAGGYSMTGSKLGSQ